MFEELRSGVVGFLHALDKPIRHCAIVTPRDLVRRVPAVARDIDLGDASRLFAHYSLANTSGHNLQTKTENDQH